MRETGKDNLIWHMSSKYGCEVNQWIKHAKILSMPWDCGSIDNSDASKSILEGQTYQVSWFCGETRGFYGNLMVSLWDTKISRETDIQGDGVQFPWIFSFVPCKIDLFIYFTLSINLQVFFFPNILIFVVDLQVFGLLGLRGLLFSLENLLYCC